MLRVQIGLIYSAVQLDSGALGVAYTFPQSRDCASAARRGPLASSRASRLLEGLAGPELLARSLALATANALLAEGPASPAAHEGDILEHVEIRDGDQVCMVGCFLPVLASLQERHVTVKAVDQEPKPRSLPAEEVERLLPASQVAIITATSLINGTLGHLLHLASGCREVALLGPSTPLAPEAFRATPITFLAGIRVQEPLPVLQCIAEGQGFREFKRHVRKLNIRLAAALTHPASSGRAAGPGPWAC